MADNITIPTTGSGTATPVVATEEAAGAHYQKVKLVNPTAGQTGAPNMAQETGGNLATIAGKDFATQTTLAAVLSKIIASPATEAKQDTGNASLSTLAGKDFATQTTLSTLNGKITACNTGAVTISSQPARVKTTDSFSVWTNTAKDGSGTNYQPLVDSDGHLQVDVQSAAGASIPSSITSGQKTVAAAATPEALAGSTPAKRVWIGAPSDSNGAATNTKPAWIGGSGAQYMMLHPANFEGYWIDIDDPAKVYIKVGVNGEKVNYTLLN